jgi:hypothetical protein
MAAPERFAHMSGFPCTAGAVHTWRTKAREAKARWAASAAGRAARQAAKPEMSIKEAARRVRELLKLDEDEPMSAAAATACRPP